MKTRSISQLKAHLSAEIKSLERDGDIIICDREMPVAVLSPYGKKKKLEIIPAKKKFDEEEFRKKFKPLDLPPEVAMEGLRFLMEDREKR